MEVDDNVVAPVSHWLDDLEEVEQRLVQVHLALSEPLPDKDDDGAALFVVAGSTEEAVAVLHGTEVLLAGTTEKLPESIFKNIDTRTQSTAANRHRMDDPIMMPAIIKQRVNICLPDTCSVCSHK